jgi:hypothetical protein
MNLLHFKNGTSFPDPMPGVAAAVKELHKNDVARPIDVPQCERWLSDQAAIILEKDQRAQSLLIDRNLVSKKLDALTEAVKTLGKTASGSTRDAQIQKGEKMVRVYEDQLVEFDRRIAHCEAIAKHTRRIVAEFHENTPDWPKALKEYKSSQF